MPNWCMNKLTVEHNDPSKLKEFVDAYNAGNVCEHYLPVPKNESGDIILDQNDPNYWYNWCVNNWGTKWDIGADVGTDREEWHGLKATVVGNQANCSFDSAWAPPIGLYNKLVELGYNVKASYFEPGMAFCGIWDNGADHYCEYTTKDMIPVALWNEFGMEEFFGDEVEA